MRLIYKLRDVEIWAVGDEFYVFGATVSGDPVVAPSLGYAQEIAAGASLA